MPAFDRGPTYYTWQIMSCRIGARQCLLTPGRRPHSRFFTLLLCSWGLSVPFFNLEGGPHIVQQPDSYPFLSTSNWNGRCHPTLPRYPVSTLFFSSSRAFPLPNAISVPNAACIFEMARASWVGAFKIKGTRHKLNLNANDDRPEHLHCQRGRTYYTLGYEEKKPAVSF